MEIDNVPLQFPSGIIVAVVVAKDSNSNMATTSSLATVQSKSNRKRSNWT